MTIIFILIFAGLTRLWSLQKYPPSLFSDEVDVALQVKSFLATGRDYYGNFWPLQFHSFSDTRTAIPIYLTTILGKIIGNIELAVRLEPAIMGILGVLAIYLLAKSLFGKTAGLIAALLLTLTPWHFTYSRVGFEVSTLFTFFVFGLYFLKNYFDTKKDLFLVLGILLLSLTPLIYSTAKLALLFLPFLILFFPGTTFSKNLKNRNLLISLAFLFLPLAIIDPSSCHKMANDNGVNKFSHFLLIRNLFLEWVNLNISVRAGRAWLQNRYLTVPHPSLPFLLCRQANFLPDISCNWLAFHQK